MWRENTATLDSEGVLRMEDCEDSNDAATVTVSQALVMAGAASHPLLARRSSFCLAVSSSIAYFMSCRCISRDCDV